MKNLYKKLLDYTNVGKECVILTVLDQSSEIVLSKVLLIKDELDRGDFLYSFECTPELAQKIRGKCEMALGSGSLQTIELKDSKILFVEPFIPKPRLIIYGGGHISQPLVELASRVGFIVTVIDDRPSFANKGRFPDANKVICESFEKSFDMINLHEKDFVVIVTRGHRYDSVILRKIIKQPLQYIGMIGSKRRVRGMMDEMISEGYSKHLLSSVNSPIGLDIFAITPDEIAISIVAQLIQYKNKITRDQDGKRARIPEFDHEVIQKIWEDSEVPKALITILSSKGSVPRKAGAKMIAYYDGRTIGSIGGGCSEAAVLTKARNIMRNKKAFAIEHVDMTGEVAESEGMVCGGVMDVLIQVVE